MTKLHNVLIETQETRRNALKGLPKENMLGGSRQRGEVKYGVPCPKMANGCPAREMDRTPSPKLESQDAQSINGQDAQSINGQDAQSINGIKDAQSINGPDAQSINGRTRTPSLKMDRTPSPKLESKVPCLEMDKPAFGRKAQEGAGISLRSVGQEMALSVWHLLMFCWLSLWLPVTWFIPGQSQDDLDDREPRISMTDPAYLAMSAKEQQKKLRTFIPVKPRWEFALPAVRGSEHILPHAEKDSIFTLVNSGCFVTKASTATEMNKHASTSTAQGAVDLPEMEIDPASPFATTLNMCGFSHCPDGRKTHIVTK